MIKTATINGKSYIVIPMQRTISIDGGAAIAPYFLERAERIEGTDYYLAVYKHSDGEEVTRIVEFTQEAK